MQYTLTSVRFAVSGIRDSRHGAPFFQTARAAAVALAEPSGALRAFVAPWFSAAPAAA